MGVRIRVGATALTVRPCAAPSSAAAFTRPKSPCELRELSRPCALAQGELGLGAGGHGERRFRDVRPHLAMLREVAAAAKDAGATPELETYDLGHLYMARQLIEERTLQGPVRIQLVLGVLGGAGNELEDLFALRERAQKVLGDQLCDLGVAAVGYPMQFRHAATALGLGMDCRVGMEDSLRVKRTQPVRDNAEMVEVAVQLADLLGRPIATPDELRSRLTRWVS
ncbi:3-keto-5-aminohexanoate cleavage protein [Streptomyces sp. NPDC015127]|uniref:3-keto-5-aminohexanoate cleavage protein n=1 Tax=Streptomyces sp. NPDC015127 TaxID=3364939 RepID=UPI0037024D4C